MNSTKTSWPLGWTPSADAMNGDPQGLLRSDNLQQEEDGVISLVRGFKKLTAGGLTNGNFPDFVSDIYDRSVNGIDFLWIGLNLGRVIYRSNADLSNLTVISENGGTRPCFGDALGQVLSISGKNRKKDDTTTIRDLGLISQIQPPQVTSVSQAQVDFSTKGNWTVIEGGLVGSSGGDVQLVVSVITLRGVAELNFGSPINSLDTGDGPATDPNNDTFYFLIQPDDTSNWEKFRVEVYLDDTGGNYYWFEWPLAGSVAFNLGIEAQSVLSVSRGSFNRQGSDSNVGWDTVTKIRVIGQATAVTTFGFLVSELRMMGGAAGALNGYYTYLQVDVYDNGTYQAKGAASPQSTPAYILNGTATIQLANNADPQVNQSWLFRKSLPSPTNFQEVGNINGQNILVALPVVLDQFYRVATGVPGAIISDTLADIDALEQDITVNLFLQSVQDIPDTIIGMEGIYNERMLYLTPSEILLSDRINPDAIDTRYSIKAFGGNTEVNLWFKKISNNTIILATTKDLYEISGTLLDQPDGSIDATVFSIGEAYPPLSQDVTASNGALFYAAADGWRFTTGTNSLPIDITSSGPSRLSLLFQGFPRYGVPDFTSNPGNIERYSVAVGRGKFYAVGQCSDGTRRLIIYDLKRQTWRLQFTDPVTIHITQTNRILLGYGAGSGNFIQEAEFGIDGSVDGLEGQAIFLQTTYDHFQAPRNRKDLYTLKLVMDTGGQGVQVLLGSDGQGFSPLNDYTGHSTVSTSTGPKTFYFPLFPVAFGFRYAVRLTGTNLTTFKLFEYTYESALRPEQNVYYNHNNDNLGSDVRKRLTSLPIIIDTLGNDVHLRIFIDGVHLPNDDDIINVNGRSVFIHYFLQETIGTTIDYTLLSDPAGGPFEFYEAHPEWAISESLPQPAEFLVIPPDNFGVAAPKRLRTIPLVINTRGVDVVFQPQVDDNISTAASTFNTTQKRTVFHYFIEDVFGVDYGGTLRSSQGTHPINGFPFEFYGFGTPDQVEVLPGPKEYDQIGPIRFDKIGKLFIFRTRLIATGSSIPYRILSDASVIYPNYDNSADYVDGILETTPNLDNIYEVQLPKSVNGTIFRIIFGPTPGSPFYRFDCQIKVAESGMETDSTWVPVK